MTLPASGTIALSQFSTEMEQSSTYSASLSWVSDNTKSGQRPNPNAMNGYYNKAWYQRNNDGNCNNGNCTSNCNCGNIQCNNCVISGTVNCANCDGRKWLQNNCNCACTYNCNTSQTSYNCNCDCACACGNTCFLAGTQVFMEAGVTKAIEDVKVGDKVLGLNGQINTVVGLWRPLLGKRKLFSVNHERLITTGDHMIHTENGWSVIETDEYEKRQGQTVTLIDGGVANLSAITKVNELKVGDNMTLFTNDFEVVGSIDVLDMPEDTQLYTIATDGNYSFAIGSGIIVDGIPQEDK